MRCCFFFFICSKREVSERKVIRAEKRATGIWSVDLNTSEYYGLCGWCNVIKIEENEWKKKTHEKLSRGNIVCVWFFCQFLVEFVAVANGGCCCCCYLLDRKYSQKIRIVHGRDHERYNVFWKSIKCHAQNMAKCTLKHSFACFAFSICVFHLLSYFHSFSHKHPYILWL